MKPDMARFPQHKGTIKAFVTCMSVKGTPMIIGASTVRRLQKVWGSVSLVPCNLRYVYKVTIIKEKR